MSNGSGLYVQITFMLPCTVSALPDETCNRIRSCHANRKSL